MQVLCLLTSMALFGGAFCAKENDLFHDHGPRMANPNDI